MTPILKMADYIADEFAAMTGERISTNAARRLARAALQGLLDDLQGNVRAAALAEKAGLP